MAQGSLSLTGHPGAMLTTMHRYAASGRARRSQGGLGSLRVGTAVAIAAALLSTAACADDATNEDDLGATRAQLSAGPDPNGILGLEIISTGEVTEVVDVNAFRMDKDGIEAGVPDDLTAPSPGETPAYADLGQLDRDDFVRGDDELGYGTGQEQVLVLVPRADLDLSVGDPVRVVGTVRSLDAEAIEEVYDVQIDTDAYAPYLNQLVVVAETVSAAP